MRNRTPDTLNLLIAYADSICNASLPRLIDLCLSALGDLPARVRGKAFTALPQINVLGVSVDLDGDLVFDDQVDVAVLDVLPSIVAIIMLGLAWMIARALGLPSQRRIKNLIQARIAGVLSAARSAA